MDPVVKFSSVLLIVTTLLRETWGAPDKELLCGGKLLKIVKSLEPFNSSS